MAGIFPIPGVFSPLIPEPPQEIHPSLEEMSPAVTAVSTVLTEVHATIQADFAAPVDAGATSGSLPNADSILQEPLGPVADLNRMPPEDVTEPAQVRLAADGGGGVAPEPVAGQTIVELEVVATAGLQIQVEGDANVPAEVPEIQPVLQVGAPTAQPGKGETGPQGEVVDAGAGQAMVGQAVKKKFNNRNFVGEVKSYDETTEWYKVEYEDGDEEELTWQELEPILSVKKEKKARQRKQTAAKGGKLTKAKSAKALPASKQARRAPTGKQPAAKGRSTPKRKPESQAAVTTAKSTPAKRATPKTAGAKAVAKRPSAEKKGSAAAKPGRPPSKRAKTGGAAPSKPAKEVAPRAGASAAAKKKAAPKKKVPTGRAAQVVSAEPEIVKAMSNPGPGRDVVGRAVKKHFDGQPFFGRVKQFMAETCFYKVTYTDGDAEDLDWGELAGTIISEEEYQFAHTTQGAATKQTKRKTPAKSPAKPAGASSRAKRGAARVAASEKKESPVPKGSSRGPSGSRQSLRQQAATMPASGPSPFQAVASGKRARRSSIQKVLWTNAGAAAAPKRGAARGKGGKAAAASKTPPKVGRGARAVGKGRAKEDPVVAEEPPAKRTRHQIHSPPAAAVRGR